MRFFHFWTIMIFAFGGCSANKEAVGESIELKPESTEFLRVWRCKIIETSNTFDIPAVAIAGVILAEQELNYDLFDIGQDSLLSMLLRNNDSLWWDDWYRQNQLLEHKASELAVLSSKWPQELVHSCYVMSFGPAQITPRTVLRASAAQSNYYDSTHLNVKKVLAGLLDTAKSLRLSGQVLRFESDQYLTYTKCTADVDIALLGTLYSSGTDHYITRHQNDSCNATYNLFGKWILNRINVIHEQLFEFYISGGT